MSLSLANYYLRTRHTEDEEQEYCEYCGDELAGRGEFITCTDCQEQQDIEEEEEETDEDEEETN